jgi:hypothetical protein
MRAPTRGADDALVEIPGESFAIEQFTAEFAEFFRQRSVQHKARKADGRQRQRTRRGCLGGRKKSGALRADGTGLVEQFTQAEPRERGLAAATDEFAADAMARIMPRLVNHHRHIASPQSDAEHQTGEAAADNRDGFCPGHDSTDFPRNEEMAEGSHAVFRQLPVLFVRPECGKFVAGKTRAHAGHGIMTCDLIATNRPQQPAAKQHP